MKNCPRCKALVFDDIDTCYECLYRFCEPAAWLMMGSGVADTDNSIAASVTCNGGVTLKDDGATQNRIQKRIPLYSESCVCMGRSQTNDLVIRAANVSRVHARVSVKHGDIILEDCGSSNGTYLDGVRLSNPTRLHPGDCFTIGPAVLILSDASDAGSFGCDS